MNPNFYTLYGMYLFSRSPFFRLTILAIGLSVLTGCFLYSPNLVGQERINLKFKQPNRSKYIIKNDSCALKRKVLQKIAERLQMTFSIAQEYSETWKGEKAFARQFYYSFRWVNLTATDSVDLRSPAGDYSLKIGDQLCLIGFTSNLREGKKVDRNFSTFLLSAYRQETEPEYNNFAYNFSSLKRLSVKEFNKRNWLSMGYGLNYLTKNNPFVARNVGAMSALYIFEALQYAAIIGGPVFGATTSETVLLPVTAILSLAFWKGIVMRYFIAPPIFKMNRRIVDSGYKLPYQLNPTQEYY